MPKTIQIDARNELARILAARVMGCDLGRRDLAAELLPVLKARDIQSFFFDIPTYEQMEEEYMKKIQQETQVVLTVDYEDEDIENNSVAFYMMKGTIMAESRYWFSSKQYVKNLLAADANPRIVAHFVLVNSGGGDAYYNDVVAETVKNLTKPIVSLTERVKGSAALFQDAYTTRKYATTMFDTIGSIGTMISFLDLIPYFEAMGAKWIEEYATNSTEKNARWRELEAGKPEKFIAEVLDPLRNNFAAVMRDAIPQLKDLPEEDKIMQGGVVYTEEAITYGLVQGLSTPEKAIQEAYDLGMAQKKELQETRFFRQQILNTLNS